MATIVNPNNLTTSISGLRTGDTVLRFSVTDNFGRTIQDDVKITVVPSGAIVLNTSNDVTLTLPTNSTTLTCTATSPNGAIVSYLWTKVSGGTATIATPTAASTVISNLVEGVYKFKITVEDSIGVDAFKEINVTVQVSLPAIQVNAGSDQYLDEGTTTANFYGSYEVPSGVTVQSVTWSAVSTDSPGGIGTIQFSTPNLVNTGVTGIPVAARTRFKLTVRDTTGRDFEDFIDVSIAKPSEMYYQKGGIQNQYDIDDPELLAWIYLPQGYDPLKPGGFGLTLFLHGMGANLDWAPGNNINSLLDVEVGLPKFLYDKSYPMSSVVVMPQLRTGQWDLAHAQKALDWAIANFAIDPNKQYVTGYSSGGKGTWEVILGNPTRFAAGIPAAAVGTIASSPSNAAIIKNIPFLAVSGYNDTGLAPTFGATGPADTIDAILSQSPKGKYPPLAIFPWDTDHSPKTWSDHVYNKQTAGYDFEKWFLMHTTNEVETATNYVIEAETTKTFLDWSKALILVNQLPSSSQKTQLQTRLNLVKDILKENGERRWMVNFGTSHTFNLYTVTSLSNVAGTSLTNLVETDGTPSTIGISNISSVDIPLFTAGLDHDYMGMGRDMYHTGFMVDPSNTGVVKLTGLQTGKLYDLQLYYSNKSRDYYKPDYDAQRKKTGFISNANGDIVQSYQDGWNTTKTLNHYNIAADNSGEIIITLTPQYNHYGVIVAVLIKEKPTSQGAQATARWDFTKTTVTVPGWATIKDNPTLAIRRVIHPDTGWELNSGGTTSDYWQTVGGNWSNDTSGPVGPYPALFPDSVARSAWVTQASTASPNKPNIVIAGVPGMGLPAGNYQLRIFASTTNTAHVDATYFRVKLGEAEYIQSTTKIQNNTTNYLTFTGHVKEGGDIEIELRRDQYGYAYVNAIILERLS